MTPAAQALATNIETSATDYALQYGVVGVLAAIFGYVIVILFKRGEARDAAMNAERVAWVEKEQKIRAEAEKRVADAVTEFAKQLQAQRDAAQGREDQIRAEFSSLMERVSEEATKTSNATIDVLHKFYDRILGPKARQ